MIHIAPGGFNHEIQDLSHGEYKSVPFHPEGNRTVLSLPISFPAYLGNKEQFYNMPKSAHWEQIAKKLSKM